jgi:hypothetical protein
VFALDHGDDWYLGPDIATAVQNLIFGRVQPRLADGHTEEAGSG